ncbi:hypothetical protein V7075_19055, partial [Neobacillus drentensis]|uniref:hypothetical protein n=1 Tax=Neobacillus drentensis TaxID=220684 RepID=UPI002FFEAB4A
FYENEMVFKLPPEKHEQALAMEGAHLFEPMSGRRMKDWVSVPNPDEWEELAQEAMNFLAK